MKNTKIIQLSIALFGLCLCLWGCATSSQQSRDASGKEELGQNHLPPVLKPEAAAEIVFIRAGGPPWALLVRLNENVLFHLNRKEYCRFSLDSGKVEFSVRYFGGWWPSVHKATAAVELKPGEKYFFCLYEGGGWMKINRITEAAAGKKIADSQLVQLTN